MVERVAAPATALKGPITQLPDLSTRDRTQHLRPVRRGVGLAATIGVFVVAGCPLRDVAATELNVQPTS